MPPNLGSEGEVSACRFLANSLAQRRQRELPSSPCPKGTPKEPTNNKRSYLSQRRFLTREPHESGFWNSPENHSAMVKVTWSLLLEPGHRKPFPFKVAQITIIAPAAAYSDISTAPKHCTAQINGTDMSKGNN